jgi:hypothetical protein
VANRRTLRLHDAIASEAMGTPSTGCLPGQFLSGTWRRHLPIGGQAAAPFFVQLPRFPRSSARGCGTPAATAGARIGATRGFSTRPVISRNLGDAMEQLLGMRPKRPQPALVRFGVTATLVVACFVVLVALRDHSVPIGFYVLLPAIFAASVLFDRGAGTFGTALSVAMLYLLMRPEGMLPLGTRLLLQLLVFVFISSGRAVVSDGLRTAGERATAASAPRISCCVSSDIAP